MTRVLYTYRDDPAVPAFDDTKPIVIFDGQCVFCSGGVQWMIARDPHGDAKFAAIQEPVSRALYAHYGIDADAFDTFMVLKDGKPYLRWRGLCAAGRLMPAPWKWLGALGRIVPEFVGNAIYDFIQRNRIGWFGARSTCLVPGEATPHRLLLQ